MGVETLEIFKIQDLTYYYPESEIAALKEISLSIEEGELIFLTGYSGCGKSSLLKAMAGLLPDFYGGKIGGIIEYKGKDLRGWDKRKLPREIGIVFQDPEQQTCMTVVEHEVAFGLENLGIPLDEMRHRVVEVLTMLNLTHLKDRSIFELSNGQKQRVILASILAMHPKVLILDEPTSQLDPIAADEILDYIYRLNRDWGTTIILSEQRIERCFDMADRVLIMDKGNIIFNGTPHEATLSSNDTEPLESFFPPISKIFRAVGLNSIPINVKEGRKAIKNLSDGQRNISIPLGRSKIEAKNDILVEGRRVRYVYPDQFFSIDNMDFTFYGGEVAAIFGENGAGKSTLLKLISGILKPQKGHIRVKGDVGYISQNPNDYLFSNTVYEQLLFALELKGMKDTGQIDEILKKLHIYRYRDVNPRDLSGGEKQRVAIATVIVSDPSVILMDEPTRGMDSLAKNELSSIISSLIEEGKAIVLVTHDIEFAAELSQRILIMSRGNLVAEGDMHSMIGSSFYYSTQTAKLFRNIDSRVVTIKEGIYVLNKLVDRRYEQ